MGFFSRKSKIAAITSVRHQPDYVLMIAVGLIILFGLIMLSSATSVFAYTRYEDIYFFFKRQLVGVVIGLFGFWLFSIIDYRVWKKYAFHMLGFSIFLLVLVFIPGIGGDWGTARSWIDVFGFSVQPSEFVKITFLIYLSAWLESRQTSSGDFSQVTMPFLFVLGIISVLMLLQPDLGTLIIIGLISMIVYFVGNGNIRHIIIILLIGLAGVAMLVSVTDYQADRFRCFANPDYSPNKDCYQIKQALIAVGSGGFWGRGLGHSRQKFLYLPEVNADAIFPIISEEAGFLFGSLLIGAYLVVFYRGFLISKYAPDYYGRILAIGLVSWLSLQAMVNIGGMINAIPMTGVTLPLVSAGGSSVLASLCAIGILVNISKQTKTHNT